MGLAKRIYTECQHNGGDLRGPTLYNPAAFGMGPEGKTKSKKRRTKKASTRKDLSIGNEDFDVALEHAEMLLGRKVTIEDITGKNED